MLREVGKIYSRSFRVIFQYPLFWRLSLAVYLINFVLNHLSTLAKSLRSLGLVVLMNWINAIVIPVLYTGLSIALILMVFQSESGIDPGKIFQQIKKYFWRFVGQSWAGMFLALVYTLPVFCLVLFSVFMDDAFFITIIVPLWLLVNGFLGFGSISLGQRILLDNKGKGVFQNSLQGLHILNGNFVFFITLYLTTTLISIVLFPLRYTIGSLITGIDLFSVPISSFPLFVKNVFDATQTPIVYGWDIISGTIMFPLYTIVLTLAYLRYRPLKTDD